MDAISHDELLALVEYDGESGVFRRRVDGGSRNAKAGDIMGYLDQKSRRVDVRVKNKHYKAHRLAWFYVHGVWPNSEIDHIDRNPSNNAISNLRTSSREENSHNQVRPRVDNVLGVRGVCFIPSRNKFKTQIGVDGKNFHIGYFKTEAEAGDAYFAAKTALHKPVFQVGV